MHIIIGLITAIAGLIWALNSLQRAGVDLNALNPFTWVRRRRWEKKLGVKPMHSLTDTMEAAALLSVAIAKTSGEITRDTKMEILDTFEKAFGIKRNRSMELYSASTFMLKDTMHLISEVNNILAPSKHNFEAVHIEKLMGMLNTIASLEGQVSTEQQAFIDAVSKVFDLNKEKPQQW